MSGTVRSHLPAVHLHCQRCLTHSHELLVHCRLHMYIDFVVCVGGDGVILHASYLFKRAIPPVSLSLHFAVSHLISHTQHDCTPLQTCVPTST